MAAAATTRTAARHLPHLLLLLLLAVCAPATVRCAECWVNEVEPHWGQVTNTCLTGKVDVNGTCWLEPYLGYKPDHPARKTNIYHDSLEKCCDVAYKNGLVDKRDPFPARDETRGRNDREICLLDGRRNLLKGFIIFKGQDLPADADLPEYLPEYRPGAAAFTKVCGGIAAVAKACVKYYVAAFTYGGERDCGYLKKRFWDATNATKLKFLPSNKGWDVYVKDIALPSSIPGGKDPCTNPSITACGAKAAAFPKLSGAFKV